MDHKIIGDLESMCIAVVMRHEYVPGKIMKNDSWCLDPDSNWSPSEYKSQVLLLKHWIEVSGQLPTLGALPP
jgi:hypothetical protein